MVVKMMGDENFLPSDEFKAHIFLLSRIVLEEPIMII